MRLFTGLDLPPDVVGNLEALVAQLRPLAKISWSPAANLHITTKFIGEWPEEKLPQLRESLAGIPPRPVLDVNVLPVRFFPNGRSPKVVICGIEADGLGGLAAETDRATAALGIEPEKRAYSPHLTLARIRDPRLDLKPLKDAIAGQSSTPVGSFRAGSFFLYRSQLRPTGSVYTKLAEYPLSPQ